MKNQAAADITLISLLSSASGLDIDCHKAGFWTAGTNEYDKQISPSFWKWARSYFATVMGDPYAITLLILTTEGPSFST